MAVTNEDIARINELAAKAKKENGLTELERNEQKLLRQRYIDSVRENLRSHLERIDIKNEDGSITSLSRKADKS